MPSKRITVFTRPRLAKIVVLAAALIIGKAVPTAAAPCGGRGNGRCGQNYVDADGDGVCDNYNHPATAPVKKNTVKKTAVKKDTAPKAVVKKSTIKKVQKKLNKLGYKCGKANGIMSIKTKNAL